MGDMRMVQEDKEGQIVKTDVQQMLSEDEMNKLLWQLFPLTSSNYEPYAKMRRSYEDYIKDPPIPRLNPSRPKKLIISQYYDTSSVKRRPHVALDLQDESELLSTVLKDSVQTPQTELNSTMVRNSSLDCVYYENSQNTQNRPPEMQTNRKMRPQYKTKNLLQAIGPYFLNYLKRHLTLKELSECQSYQNLSEGAVNLQKIQTLLNDTSLKRLWTVFFAQKVLERSLMCASIAAWKKKIYFSKLHIFKRAFETGELKKIN